MIYLVACFSFTTFEPWGGVTMQNKETSCCHNNAAHAHVSIKEELLCHFPYAVFAVAFALMLLSMLGYGDPTHQRGLHSLFHTTHFLHILFAASGTVLVARRFGAGIIMSTLQAVCLPAIFCTISDSIMPYLGGKLAGLDMHWHWCFYSHLSTVIPFLIFGVLTGFVMSTHAAHKQASYAAFSHFMHIFVSAFASTAYLVSHGYVHWVSEMGFVFSYLIIAVLIPCTIADVIVPMFFATRGADRKGS